MKKLLFSIIFLCFLSSVFACPFCGCGSGNVYMGLYPDYKHQFFGLRYNYSTFHTVLANDPSQFSHNTYNTVEFWYGAHITQKFQVLLFVPYHFDKQADDDGNSAKKGLGDITVLGQYEVFNKVKMNTKKRSSVQQQLWLGAGFKLPTGVFGVDVLDSATTLADVNAQLGTGSVDVLLNGLYSLRAGNFGVNVNANYKINTPHNEVRFGNQLSLNSVAYYRVGLGHSSLSPNIGINYEHTERSNLPSTLKDFVPYTQSHVYSGSLGVEYNIKSIGIGITGQLPLQQNFADGQTKLNFRGLAHVTIAI